MGTLYEDNNNVEPIMYASEESGLNSEKVQGMANSVYAEFKRMMACYGEDSIKELMPLIVTILESLDQSLTECNENVVEIEMLKDDNEQLAQQFERERQLRRSADQQLLENEDLNEQMSREIQNKTELLESETRHLELKCKNFKDQIDRLQERESELRKEYAVLHDRHTEVVQNYMEHIEKTKAQQAASTTEVSSSPQLKRESLPSSLHSTSPEAGPSNYPVTPTSTVHSPVTSSGAIVSAFLNAKEVISNTSLQEEIANSTSPPTPVSATNDIMTSSPMTSPLRQSDNKDEADDVKEEEKKTSVETMDTSPGSDDVVWAGEDADDDEFKDKLNLTKDELKLDVYQDEKKKINHIIETPSATAAELGFDTSLHDDSFNSTLNSQQLNNNESSLFAELSKQDLGDVDDGADIMEPSDNSGMSKEMENILAENRKLLATKNALNVVKDDLIQQVDQLTTQHTIIKEELEASEKSKAKLRQRVTDCEKQLQKLQEELKNVANGVSMETTALDGKTANDDDDVVPMSQRKRFTRVEMARVLMERNQYKERLMELQEAVRWTETIRASRILNNPDANKPDKSKNKSTIFQFFSRLFTSNSAGDGPTTGDSPHPAPSRPRTITNNMSGQAARLATNGNQSKLMGRSKSTSFSFNKSPTNNNDNTARDDPACNNKPPSSSTSTISWFRK